MSFIVKPCKYCDKEVGGNFKINKSPSLKEFQPNKGFLHLIGNDDYGIVLLKNGTACGTIDIKFCPFCGREL